MTSELPFRAYLGNESYVFISYAHSDKDIVYLEMLWIHQKGFRIWYDEGIPPTSEWPEEIEKALLNCKLFLVFITPTSIERPMIRTEINFALDNNKLFLAVFLEPTELKYGLRLRFNNLQYLKRFELKEEYYQQKVLDALKKVKPIKIDKVVKEKEKTKAEEKAKKEAEANLKKVIIFKDAQIPQFEADILQEIEVQTKMKFTKENSINRYTSMGYTAESGRVTGIGLFKCGISNLPESIDKLQSLKELYLGDNNLKALPESIGNLKLLQDLHLEENELMNLPESIGNLKSLQTLDLVVSLLETLPESIGNLESLQLLRLWHNQLTNIPESIGNLRSLQYFYLDSNLLEILPESIQKLKEKGLKINGKL